MRAAAFLIDEVDAIIAVKPRRRDWWRVLLGRYVPDVQLVPANSDGNLRDRVPPGPTE